ncbi:hypothetical protein GmHk_20G058309 [Glycine max]|nr:hypothetical protein GmHk_20G058309 [Glycine max]
MKHKLQHFPSFIFYLPTRYRCNYSLSFPLGSDSDLQVDGALPRIRIRSAVSLIYLPYRVVMIVSELLLSADLEKKAESRSSHSNVGGACCGRSHGNSRLLPLISSCEASATRSANSNCTMYCRDLPELICTGNTRSQWSSSTILYRKHRNSVVFNNQIFSPEKVMDEALFHTWSWLKCMDKDFDMHFNQWSSNLKEQLS